MKNNNSSLISQIKWLYSYVIIKEHKKTTIFRLFTPQNTCVYSQAYTITTAMKPKENFDNFKYMHDIVYYNQIYYIISVRILRKISNEMIQIDFLTINHVCYKIKHTKKL